MARLQSWNIPILKVLLQYNVETCVSTISIFTLQDTWTQTSIWRHIVYHFMSSHMCWDKPLLSYDSVNSTFKISLFVHWTFKINRLFTFTLFVRLMQTGTLIRPSYISTHFRIYI